MHARRRPLGAQRQRDLLRAPGPALVVTQAHPQRRPPVGAGRDGQIEEQRAQVVVLHLVAAQLLARQRLGGQQLRDRLLPLPRASAGPRPRSRTAQRGPATATTPAAAAPRSGRGYAVRAAPAPRAPTAPPRARRIAPAADRSAPPPRSSPRRAARPARSSVAARIPASDSTAARPACRHAPTLASRRGGRHSAARRRPRTAPAAAAPAPGWVHPCSEPISGGEGGWLAGCRRGAAMGGGRRKPRTGPAVRGESEPMFRLLLAVTSELLVPAEHPLGRIKPIVAAVTQRRLPSADHFSREGTLLAAWASSKTHHPREVQKTPAMAEGCRHHRHARPRRHSGHRRHACNRAQVHRIDAE